MIPLTVDPSVTTKKPFAAGVPLPYEEAKLWVRPRGYEIGGRWPLLRLFVLLRLAPSFDHCHDYRRHDLGG